MGSYADLRETFADEEIVDRRVVLVVGGGEERKVWRFGVKRMSDLAVSSILSRSPNSSSESPLTESSTSERIPVPTPFTLVLRAVNEEEEGFRAGDVTVEERLAIRGMRVGVSFGQPEVEPGIDELCVTDNWSLNS